MAAAVVGSLGALAGCGGSSEPTSQPDSIRVSSSAFADGDPIPAAYTCFGAGTSPPLAWDHVPADATTLALVVTDPDAPGGDFTHWFVLGIAPRGAEVAAGAAPDGRALENSAGTRGWTPPCPPSGTHHYHFRVYALDRHLLDVSDTDAARDQLSDHTIAWGELTGTVRSR